MNRLQFQGKGLAYFRLLLPDVVLSIVSLFLLYPRTVVRQTVFFCSNLTLDGIPFEFHGSRKVYFNGFMRTLLVTLLMCIVAAGFTFLLQYVLHVDRVLMPSFTTPMILLFVWGILPFLTHGNLVYFIRNLSWGGQRADYKGTLGTLFPLMIRGILLMILTAGIYRSWYEVQLNQYVARNLRFGQLRFDFDGSPAEAFRIHLKGFLLSLVTLGIYSIWYYKEWYAYTVDHTVVKLGDQSFRLHSDANTRDVFEYRVGNLLLVLFTLGFGSAWAIVRSVRFHVEHSVLPAGFDLSLIKGEPTDEEDALPLRWLDRHDPHLLG